LDMLAYRNRISLTSFAQHQCLYSLFVQSVLLLPLERRNLLHKASFRLV
jgi:hypothetical protein